jgi:signal-transduction protein with cAMP-binding, CBS, and nucleotidyltransferase domain
MLSHISCQIFEEDTTILSYNDEVKNIYLIRYGVVKVFDENFNFLVDYHETSFFGEF